MLVDVCFIFIYCSIYCYDTSLLRDMHFSIIFIVVLFLIIAYIFGTPRRFIEVSYPISDSPVECLSCTVYLSVSYFSLCLLHELLVIKYTRKFRESCTNRKLGIENLFTHVI